jgi:hypothetical protein
MVYSWLSNNGNVMTNLSDLFPSVPTYTPAMMEFDGSTGYYNKASVSTSGNKIAVVGRFNCSSSTNIQRVFDVHNGSYIRAAVSILDSDHATTDSRNKLQLFIQSSTGVLLCRVYSNVTVSDGVNLTFLISYDGDAGTAALYLDGVDALDTGNSLHTLIAGTVASGLSTMSVGASYAPAFYHVGDIGFIGHREAYLTNWSDFMDANGNPKALDESTWTEWGAQPLFWNEHGEMSNNLGSAGNMTKNGTIIVGKGGN